MNLFKAQIKPKQTTALCPYILTAYAKAVSDALNTAPFDYEGEGILAWNPKGPVTL
jgi:hypothetical protein